MSEHTIVVYGKKKGSKTWEVVSSGKFSRDVKEALQRARKSHGKEYATFRGHEERHFI